jgi:non-ribosomal peptide synthetase component F
MKVSDFNLLSENDDQQALSRIVADFNRTTTTYPSARTTHCVFSEQARRRPDSIAVVAGHRTLTYRDLEELRSSGVAATSSATTASLV